MTILANNRLGQGMKVLGCLLIFLDYNYFDVLHLEGLPIVSLVVLGLWILNTPIHFIKRNTVVRVVFLLMIVLLGIFGSLYLSLIWFGAGFEGKEGDSVFILFLTLYFWVTCGINIQYYIFDKEA